MSKTDINASSPSARSPLTALHIAAHNGNSVMVQLLLWNEANPNCRDEKGRTPLDYAQEASQRECCDILIQNGAIPSGGAAPGANESFSFDNHSFSNGHGVSDASSVSSPNSSFHGVNRKQNLPNVTLHGGPLGNNNRPPSHKNLLSNGTVGMYNGQSSVDVLEKLPASII